MIPRRRRPIKVIVEDGESPKEVKGYKPASKPPIRKKLKVNLSIPDEDIEDEDNQPKYLQTQKDRLESYYKTLDVPKPQEITNKTLEAISNSKRSEDFVPFDTEASSLTIEEDSEQDFEAYKNEVQDTLYEIDIDSDIEEPILKNDHGNESANVEIKKILKRYQDIIKSPVDISQMYKINSHVLTKKQEYIKDTEEEIKRLKNEFTAIVNSLQSGNF
ncbi:BA75_04620T0 [Komagataella pastoris]|uniref:BA75_04620T0 n=1 Tax=Komagataella pastoris TaxID=4922 RepID=A0A1B2JHL4_PICPA|nr:BA75_04620T0 [Komagataella pastoris]